MSSNKLTYFLSDLHLGSTYDQMSAQREKRVADFLLSIADTAQEIYLVGDILDYWYEYRTVVPRGYIRFFGALATLADRGVKITWLIGNHDIWLFDYLRNEIGIDVVDGYLLKEIHGRRFFISHGDGLGKLPRGFRCIRAIFRNRFCQILYSAIHPRWTVAFAHRWSSHSRLSGNEEHVFDIENDHLAMFANDWQRNHAEEKVDWFVFGHRHIVVDKPLQEGGKIMILGDWLSHFTYAVFDGEEMKILSHKN